MRFALLPLFALSFASLIRADGAAEIATIHGEAIGGRARIEALVAIRATGNLEIAGKRIRFVLIAARPNKLRLETMDRMGVRVQATNGNDPAWELDSTTVPGRYREMPEGLARTFLADAEFDDPLVAAVARGFDVDFAGELNVAGKRRLRLQVTGREMNPSHLILDGHTYLLLNRVEERRIASGRITAITTSYEDFGPVAGVLLPHKVTTSIDGRVTQIMAIVHIEPNPVIALDAFDPRPVVASSFRTQ